MARIYLVRHCESEGNACRRTQAHVEALVTRKGYEQCEMLRRRFEGIPIQAIYTSDSYRSIMTATPISCERGIPIHVRISLREITTGIWEDMAWGNITKEYPVEHRHWTKTPWNIITPGASTFQEVAGRAIFGLRRIAREIGEDGTALVVSHSCTIKSALCLILGKPMEEVGDLGHGDNTSVSLLEVDSAGNLTVSFRNDASHLPKRLQRAWGGMAGADVNMAVYPLNPETQREELLKMAEQNHILRGSTEAFDREAYWNSTKALLSEHPNYIAISTLHDKICGFVRLGRDGDLRKDCGVLEEMYVAPELQGRGYCEQLFGYAAHEFRYADFRELVVRRNCTKEEQRVVDCFVFEEKKGFPAYQTLFLYCPPCPYPIMA